MKLNPPMSAPATVETPPTTTSSTIGKPSSIVKSCVPAVPRCIPSIAPAKPAIAADRPKTESFSVMRFTPSVALAASLSRSATSRRP